MRRMRNWFAWGGAEEDKLQLNRYIEVLQIKGRKWTGQK